VLATSSIYTITETVAFRFSSGLAPGSASAMSNALVFWQLPFGIFSASITTVLFPRMSRQASRNDTEGLRESIQYGLRFLFVLLAPSAVFMIIFGKEIISVAIQRGMFTPENTLLTASVLAAYSYGLFSVGAFNFLQRFFYSCNDFRTPFRIAVLVCVLDIALSVLLKDTALSVSGLALANTISSRPVSPS
jgi:putative peptidoglycan lipid II flippase